jgi:CBS domain-containing protein
MHDIAEFLKGRDPFGGLDEAELERLAARTEVEFFGAGARIPGTDGPRGEVMRVVRRGAIDLIEGDRPIDRLEEGELLGRPGDEAVEAQAAEDTLTYALPASELLPLLEGRRRPGAGRAGRIAPAPPAARPAVILAPETSLRDAARAIDEAGTGVALIGESSRLLGILTDSDLRSRVVAGGLPFDAPASEAMSSPVISTGPDRDPSELAMVMLEHDVHHLPVVAGSEVIGVIDSLDLLAPDGGGPFAVRRAISHAGDAADLREAAGRLPPTVSSMHRDGMPAALIGDAIALVTDALVRRSIELTSDELAAPSTEFAWLALGSHGRREPAPSSDLDSGLVWRTVPESDQESVKRHMLRLAESVESCLREVGWKLDPHGVTASGSFSASSEAEWGAAVSDWLERPGDERVSLALAITTDARVVVGPEELNPRRLLWEGREGAGLLRVMLRWAIERRPPTGFMGRIVVERSGEHSGTLDLKRGGLSPVVDLARVAALEAGIEATSTPARLEAASGGGMLGSEQAQSLSRAHELFAELRLDHQVRQLDDGRTPDDHLDPDELDPLTRSHLRDAFREIDSIQRSFERRLESGRGRI